MNLYRCVLNDPVNLVDPLGLDEDDGTITVVGGVRDWTLEQVNTWMGAHVTKAPLPDSGEIEEIVVEGRRKPKQRRNPCAGIPAAVLDYMSARMGLADFLNTHAMQSGGYLEAGGAVGRSGGQFIFSFPEKGRQSQGGRMALNTLRSIFERRFDVGAIYDWHTHFNAGVSNATYGFSSQDVRTTALTGGPDFRGSFIVMPDRVLYLSREAALNQRVGNSFYGTAGVRCF